MLNTSGPQKDKKRFRKSTLPSLIDYNSLKTDVIIV